MSGRSAVFTGSPTRTTMLTLKSRNHLDFCVKISARGVSANGIARALIYNFTFKLRSFKTAQKRLKVMNPALLNLLCVEMLQFLALAPEWSQLLDNGGQSSLLIRYHLIQFITLRGSCISQTSILIKGFLLCPMCVGE